MFIRLIACGFFCLFSASSAWAAVQLTSQERNWLDANSHQITLWFDPYYPPIEFLSPDGRFQGLGADMMALIEERLGITFIKKPSPNWSEQLNALKNGGIHISPVIVPSEDRSEYAFFSKTYMSIPLVIITRKNSASAHSLDQFTGKRIATVKGYVSETYLRNNFSNRLDIVTVSNIEQGLRDTAFGVVDAFIGNLATAAYYIDKDQLPNLKVAGNAGYEHRLSFAVNKNFPLLFSSMQKALADLTPQDIKMIRDKWIFLEPPGMLSREEKQFLEFALTVSLSILLVFIALALGLKKRLASKARELDAAEQAVIEQKNRLDLALKATQAAIWDLHPQSGAAVFSEDWYTILGYTPAEVPASFDGWAGLIHPDDLKQTTGILNAYLDSGGAGIYQSQFRMRNKKGQWRWILGKGQAVAWDEEGRPTRMIGLNIDIHKQKAVEQALRDSEAVSTALFNQTFNFMGLLDLEGRIIKINNSALKKIKYDQNLIGTSFWQAPCWPDREDALTIGKQAMETAKKGLVYRNEVRQLNKSGDIRYIDFAFSPLKDSKGNIVYFIPEGRDITPFRKALKHIEQSEQRFRSIFENAPYAIVINSFEDGRYLDVNTAYLKSKGVTRDQALAMSPEQISSMDSQEQAQMRERILQGGVFNIETRSGKPDGSFAHVLYSAVPIPYGDKQAILSMVVDVTELRKAEEMMIQTEKIVSLGGIAAGIAHEINNPLGIILQSAQNLEQRIRPGFAKNMEAAQQIGLDLDLMAEYIKNRKLDAFIGNIRNAAIRATDIIRRMLLFSRKSESRKTVCNLQEIIEDAISLAKNDFDLRKSYDFTKIDVNVSVDNNLPGIKCTGAEIAQVLLNLLRNAAQAMAVMSPPPQTPQINIHVYGSDNAVRIDVSDNGPGMTDDIKKRIMEPFFTTKKAGVGTGLGLSVSYFIITRGHSGKFSVSSRPGQGTTFTIELPCE